MRSRFALIAVGACVCVCVAVATAVAAASMPEYCGRAPFMSSRVSHPMPLQVTDSGAAATLLQVQILHRHGDRTSTQPAQCWVGDDAVFECPLEPSTLFLDRNVASTPVKRLYRKNYEPDVEVTPGNCFIGQLTSQGYEQHLANGADLRVAYVDSGFLSKDGFDRKEIRLRSTDVPRTVQSVSALVWGMYPPTLNSDGSTPVLDIHTRDGAVEDLTPSSPAWIALQTEALNSTGYAQLIAPYVPIEEQIFAAINTSFTDIGSIMDCMNAHACHGYALPVSTELFNEMETGVEAAAYYLYTYPDVQTAARTGMGPYYDTVRQRLADAVNGHNNNGDAAADAAADAADVARMYIDSGHDSSVMPFIAGLQTSDGKWASYAVYTTIELYAVGGTGTGSASSYAVRFIYRGKSVQMPYCSALLCPYDEFDAYLKSISPTHEERAARAEVLRQQRTRLRSRTEVADAPQRLRP